MLGADGILKRKETDNFITQDGEELLFAERQHVIVFLQKIILLTLLFSFFLVIDHILFFINFSYLRTYILTGCAIIFVYTILVIKSYVDWYYRFYVVTTKKIFDIKISPLFSNSVNEVLLDQVRITEVDVRIKNFVYELLDVGDIIIRFDSPSHEECLVLPNLYNPENTVKYLGDRFENIMSSSSVWFPPRENHFSLFRSTMDVPVHHVSRGVTL